MVNSTRRRRWTYAAAAVTAASVATATALTASASTSNATILPSASAAKTATPIQHVVVIFDENVSFDHYFGTYPYAANDGTGPKFTPAKNTPTKINTALAAGVLPNTIVPAANPNKTNAAPNPNQYQPQRLTAAQAVTCSQNHGASGEEQAADGGKMDQFVQASATNNNCTTTGVYKSPGMNMDYYDGNTVTAEWNYAQQFALSDNSWNNQFGPSTPGALNLVSGQTHGFNAVDSKTGAVLTTGNTSVVSSPSAAGLGTVTGDPDPAYDDCADSDHTSTSALAAAQAGQKNIGDLLNAQGVSWGWFQGGFAPSKAYNDPSNTKSPGYALCDNSHVNVAGGSSVDYSPHHNPFAYYASTSNPHHLAPSNPDSLVGQPDATANHNYDLTYFNQALSDGYLPSVSFLKGAQYQDGHPGNSDPVDEQHFLVSEINAIQKSKFWPSTAIVIAYDDSDGWYDHQAPTILNGSSDPTVDSATCTTGTPAAVGGYQDRCGPGTRQPLLVISPFAKTNYVDHTLTTQASILKFIEDNWKAGQIGDSSFDATAEAGSLNGLFNFKKSNDKQVLLRQDGTVASVKPITALAGAVPVISGKAVEKKKLSVKTGTWAPSGLTFTYQWYANGKPIRNATKSTFTLTKTFVGKKIAIKVTGTIGSFTLTKTSKPTAKVAK